MTTTIEAPARMGRRREVLQLLADVPTALEGQRVVVLSAGALGTTSFVDELVAEVLVRRRAAELRFVDASAYLQELASRSAMDLGVSERLAFA